MSSLGGISKQYIQYYDDGSYLLYTLKDGALNGVYREWNSRGKLIVNAIYENNRKIIDFFN